MVKNDPPTYGNYLDDDEWYGHYSGVSSHNRNLPMTYGNTTNQFHNPKKADTVLTADDFVGKQFDDIADIVEGNPIGTANWINDIIDGNDGLVELCSTKDEHDEWQEDQLQAIKGGK
jgi:hypothetical protein